MSIGCVGHWLRYVLSGTPLPGKWLLPLPFLLITVNASGTAIRVASASSRRRSSHRAAPTTGGESGRCDCGSPRVFRMSRLRFSPGKLAASSITSKKSSWCPVSSFGSCAAARTPSAPTP
ncbi:hypothetical protein TcCL_ESM05371 [Trypanosoma cruzi]|nr:hypothetical protein TcCL_ESM05371 [Trypanosoma cruzi]